MSENQKPEASEATSQNVEPADANKSRPAKQPARRKQPKKQPGKNPKAQAVGGSAAKPAETTKEKPARKSGKLSMLDAAAKVLGESNETLTCKQMIDLMSAKKYWSSPNGATPEATLSAAIHREITTKGDQTRFHKVGRGLFALAKVGTLPTKPNKPAKPAKPSKASVKPMPTAERVGPTAVSLPFRSPSVNGRHK